MYFPRIVFGVNLQVMKREANAIPRRGASSNPANRFKNIQLEQDLDWDSDDGPSPATHFLKDNSGTIINDNDDLDALQMSGYGQDVATCQIACKLAAELAILQTHLLDHIIEAKNWDEARKKVKLITRTHCLGVPGHWSFIGDWTFEIGN